MLIATNSEKIDISLEDKTSELAKNFSRTLNKGDVVYFHGEIGVGKTTFIRHLIYNLQQLNKINLTDVTSPTFNLVSFAPTFFKWSMATFSSNDFGNT